MEYNSESIYVTSIDIGVHHLALCLAELNRKFEFQQIVWFDLINITQFVHLDEKAEETCTLHHKKLVCDYMEHVFYLNHNLFEISQYILIERQPPGGITSVEQLIMYKFREKAILISPVSMHSKLGWNVLNLTYQQRKEYACAKALQILQQNENRTYLVDNFFKLERRHDVADAICMIWFWVRYKARFLYIQQELTRLNAMDVNFDLMYLEQFKYVD